ncbi:MAG: M28 family peptidase [Gemmatimonadetes bacterium]|nr:M28 family peptidase [Gemmatimonadota bacterium]
MSLAFRACCALALVVVGCRSTPSSGTAPAPGGSAISDSAQVAQDIATLADDRFEGRRTGTPGNDSAAAWLSRRYAALTLQPPPGAPCGAGCANGYLRPFAAREPRRNAAPLLRETRNVVGIIRGTDPVLRDEYVVIGAHFDHLGRSTEGALDPAAGDAIRNGADDNASGSAAILALAKRLRQKPTKRSVLVVHFSGEEQGLLGSAAFVETTPIPLSRMVAMLNFDMVGRMRDDKVIVYGLATAAEMRAVLDSAAAGLRLNVSQVPDGTGPSDHSSFYLKDLPVLHFFTDVHPDYHRATDDFPAINVAGAVRVVDLAERALRTIADRPARLTFTKAPSTQRAAAGPGNGAYFGSIPDMGAADDTGMRLSGVSPGGPAEKAGLKAGDLIVEFGGRAVKNIYDYTDAIGASRPGDVVAVVVVRGPSNERLTISVTLGRRGG